MVIVSPQALPTGQFAACGTSRTSIRDIANLTLRVYDLGGEVARAFTDGRRRSIPAPRSWSNVVPDTAVFQVRRNGNCGAPRCCRAPASHAKPARSRSLEEDRTPTKFAIADEELIGQTANAKHRANLPVAYGGSDVVFQARRNGNEAIVLPAEFVSSARFKDILRLKARLCVAQITASQLATLLAVPALLLVFCRDSVSSLRHGLERSLAAAPVPGLRWNLRAA